MTKRRQGWKVPLTVVLLAVAAVGMIRHFHIKNFHCVVPGVLYTSGQPKGMDYTRLLYKYHIATFVNVRQSDEHRERNWYNQERTWMSDNGAGYVELPISRKDRKRQFPDEATRREFLELMSDKENLPVLIHGSSGRKRVSMLAGVWLIESEKWPADKAIKVMEKIRGKSLSDLERGFVRGLGK